METRNFHPKVSIIIPVYNGADFVGEAIESALSQTYDNYEIIVVNDGSADNGRTEEIVKSYGNRIRYFLKENGGVSSALNYGIKQMKGEYFSWLSHDDKYTPDKLTNLIALMSNAKTDKLVALTGVTHIDKNSKRVKAVPYYFEHGRVYSGREIITYMLNHGVLNGCALLIPKEAFENCGGFDEELRYNQDALMWYQIFGEGYNLIVDMENQDVMYRLHPNQASKTRRDLLLRDSLRMTKIVAPILMKEESSAKIMLKAFSKRYARHDCRDAVDESIRIGKAAGVFSYIDCAELKGYLLLGKVRNLMKKIFLEVRLKR